LFLFLLDNDLSITHGFLNLSTDSMALLNATKHVSLPKFSPQHEGIDYKEIFAPVAKLITVHCLLIVVAIHNWPLYQMEIQNVFLYGKLQEEVYMLPPLGCRRQGENIVCWLHKSSYVLNRCPEVNFESSLQQYIPSVFANLRQITLYSLKSKALHS